MAAISTPPHRLAGVPRISAVALVVLGCVVYATSGARLRAQEARPTFRARTELVRLDVSVTDKDGRPVGDVRPDEIAITENGERRRVVLFRHVSEVREADRDADTRTFEEVSANSVAPSGHLYVLVFDQSHTGADHEQRARLAAERFVTRELKPGDAVAVYGLPGPGPSLNLTTDLVRARVALTALHGQAQPPIGGIREADAYHVGGSGSAMGDLTPVPRPMDIVADMRAGTSGASAARAAAASNDGVGQAETVSQIFLSQLAGVMRRLQVVDGRKTFVLFSEGFFMDNLVPRLEQVASAAARSNSAVYAIDLGSGLPAPDQAASMVTAADASERRDPLATLALETNGRLFTNAGNLDRVMAGIAAETSDYYLVAFEPASSDAPQGYHRVKVETTRRGLVVHARTGYATTPEPNAFDDRQAIDVALAVPRTSTAIPIEYTTYERSGPTADRPGIIASVTAYLPGRANDAAGDQDRSDIVFVVRDTVTGQAVASGTDRLAAARPRSATDAGGLNPVAYCVQFDVPPGEYWMRVLVREPGGVIGTADRRFHVWPLTGAKLTTSDLIVTRLEGARFDPPAHATVYRDDDVLAYIEIYGTMNGVEPHVEILRGGSPEVVATVEPMVKAGSRGETIVRAHLPVSGLADGPYAVRVRLVAPNQAPQTVIRNFRVVGAETRAHTQQQ